MDIYLVRHGETTANKEGRYRGWSETPLTEEGYLQGKRVAEELSKVKIQGIFSSDLSRARETAEFIAYSQGMKMQITPQLREINFGVWEGLNYQEAYLSYKKELVSWYNDPFGNSIPEGESLSDVYWRIHSFLESLREKRDFYWETPLVIVSHGGLLKVWLFYGLGMEKDKFWNLIVDNASLSLVRLTGNEQQVLYYNRTSHLKPKL